MRKQRELYITEQTRIHFDRVEGLGNFMELEVVLAPGAETGPAAQIAEDLMKRLAIGSGDLIEGAYIDLLEEMATVE